VKRPHARRRRLAVAGLLAAAIAPASVTAQVPTLDRVDSLVSTGAYADARDTLDRWWSAREAFEVPGSDRARALMLRARLAPDPESAEPDYLAVVLGYPMSSHAPEALLRLGQGLLADGDATRAAAYLQRLVADYPGRPQRPFGLLWLARANSALRRYAAACRAALEGLDGSRSDPDLGALLRVEAGAACSVSPEAAPPVAPDREPERAEPERQRAEPTEGPLRAPDRPATPAETVGGRFAVQTGAFRYPASARALVEKLEGRGFSPRTVLVPANALLRVRLGRFATTSEAAALVDVLKAQGFDAIVVGDAREEREP
jgi:cell division septation protein DedD